MYSQKRMKIERKLSEMEADLDRSLGATWLWPVVNSSIELFELQARGHRGPFVISPGYSLSPAARKAWLAIAALEG